MPSPGPRDGRHRVVVVGGGFGGLQAALELRGAPVEVTALDRRNFCLFQPLTYQVATGGAVGRRGRVLGQGHLATIGRAQAAG